MSTATSPTSFNLVTFWRDGKVRSVIFQILALALLFMLFSTMIGNAVQNYALLDKTFGFDFLFHPSGYDIAENQAFIPYDSTSPHWKAALIGILNTLNVAFWGIIAATIVGVVLGILRLSNNWLISRLTYCFVEFTRNVPVLLQILFWQGIFNNVFPPPKSAINVADSIFIMNRGLNVPRPIAEPLFWLTIIAFILGIIASIIYAKRAKKIQNETGKISPVLT
ncbi:MAG: ABC transporter permease subunit, partial [Pseudomonadota bacterium]